MIFSERTSSSVTSSRQSSSGDDSKVKKILCELDSNFNFCLMFPSSRSQ